MQLQGFRDAVLDRTGLTRKTATGDGGIDVILTDDAGNLEGLAQDETIRPGTTREGLAELRERGATTLAADFASEAGILDFIARLKDHTDSLRAIVHNASDWETETPGHEAEVFQRMVSDRSDHIWNSV